MQTIEKKGLTRRALLGRAAAAGALSVTGLGFIAAPNAAWAMEVSVITPAQMATLLQMARDIYPHDRLNDLHYAKPLAELLAKQPELIADGLHELQASAEQRHGQPFEGLNTEIDRVALLREIETGPFFRAVRNALMFGLYDNPALFPLFGYEGSSVEKGGYLARGYNDLDWL